MDWNRIEGNWKQTSGKIKEKWANSPTGISYKSTASVNQFEGKIQERYGIAKDQVRTDQRVYLSVGLI
jgi:uncharacterized protein YjbJ (UPF0337 family)